LVLLLLALAVPAGAWAVTPEITSATTFTVPENTTDVATLTATDPQSDPLTWSIPTAGGADGVVFSLTTAGALTFAAAPDYETPTDTNMDNVYEVTVQVSDGSNMTTADLEVTVTNVAEGVPNIVLILADDMGYGDVAHLNAQSRISTPHLDALAQAGMTFLDAHTPSSICTPTRYGLLTGRYAWRTRLKRGALGGYDSPLLDSGRATLGSLLQAAGYRTAAIGKWHLGLDGIRENGSRPRTITDGPHTHGFDESYILPASLDIHPYVYIRDGVITGLPLGRQAALSFPRFIRAGDKGTNFDPAGVLDALIDEAEEFIEQQAANGQTFLLYLPLTAPHQPVWPAERFEGTTALGSYGDFIAHIDAAVGDVMSALDDAEVADDTLLIFTSDNGSFMYQCESGKKRCESGKDHAGDSTRRAYFPASHTPNHVYRGTKTDIWEGGHRVPFFVRWPGEITAGSTSEEVISLTDVFATVAEIVGHELSEHEAEDSFSVLPLLRGDAWARPRAAVIHHSSDGMFAIRDGDWKLVAGNGSGGRESPKGSPFQRPYQLFDITSDPAEQHNVYAQQPLVVQRLERALTCIRDRDRSRLSPDEIRVLTLTLTPDSLSESGAESSTVTATLSPAPSETTTVTITAPADDVTLSQNRTLTIAAEATDSSGTVTLTARDNAVDGPETKAVTVTGTADDVCVAGPVTVPLEITDDDERGVTLAAGGQSIPAGGLSIVEGTTGTYTVELTSAPTETVTITVASDEAAVRVQPDSLTFTPTTWQSVRTVTIRTEHDADGEDVDARLTHTVKGGDYGANNVEAADVAVTVNDDESPSTGVALRVNPTAVGEGAGRTVTVTGTLNRAVLLEDVAVTVSVAGDTATVGDDFTAVEDFTLEIAARQSSGTATFTLAPVSDNIYEEPDETITVSGTASALVDGVTATTLTITDNDNPPTLAELGVTTDRIAEAGGTTTVTVTLSNPSSEATEVGLTVPSGAGAVTLSPNPLTIPAKTESGMVTVNGVPDAAYTSHRAVTLRGRVTQPASSIQREGRLTVLDDETPAVAGESTPTVTEGDTRVAEYTASAPAHVRLVWTVAGAEAEAFAIDANGTLRFRNPPDHEMQAAYTVTVHATDRSLPEEPLTGERVVTVTVADALGEVTLSPATPRVGRRLTATVDDRDGVDVVTQWCWERSRNRGFPLADPSTTYLDCDGDTTATYTPEETDRDHYLRATAIYTDGDKTANKEAARVSDQPASSPPGGGSGGGGGGGGGPACADDRHGNSPAQATALALDMPTAGAICPAADVDYFTVTAPGPGLLFVDTPGGGQTRGTLWQHDTVVATGPTGRGQQPDRLGARVVAGPVVVAVHGQGGATGTYALTVTFVRGYLENPGPDSFQSGVSVLSGWVCDANQVEIELGTLPLQLAAYGTQRLDTAAVCGDTDNGFGLLVNWNRLGDGEHDVVAFVDGVELGRATVTVTTLGAEFVRGVTGTCEAEDFPTLGETVTLVWQQNSQNFVIARGSAPATANPSRPRGLTGHLENPGHNSFQSGVRVLSGWVCDAETVELEIGTAGRQGAAYGTERVDTLEACGDTDNGFGLLFNWNLLGDGEHDVVAFVDDIELGRATVRVTTLGAEFLRGVEGECIADDFPRLGQRMWLEWQQNSQNFVIVAVE